jgi:hypothetical protein
MDKENTSSSPATLVAILVAAHRVGDRDLERESRRRLEDEHGIRIMFAKELQEQKGANHAE